MRGGCRGGEWGGVCEWRVGGEGGGGVEGGEGPASTRTPLGPASCRHSDLGGGFKFRLVCCLLLRIHVKRVCKSGEGGCLIPRVS